jgi:hypothetical protein
MSEYQHYAFMAIDRPLSAQEMSELRALSKRATITPTSFFAEYHSGDFDGRPDEILERYFDGQTYVSNWGTRDFQIRLPKQALVREAVKPYLVENRLEVRQKGEIVILTFHRDEGDTNVEHAADWLPGLIPLRKDLMAGDLRALYLGWLSAVQDGQVADATREPPVPPGLDALTPPLEMLARVLRLDQHLLAVVAGASATTRSAKDLKSAAAHMSQDIQRQETERALAVRKKFLDTLATRESEAWLEVEAVIGMPGHGPEKTAAFKAKAKLLRDLRELAAREATSEAFETRLAELRGRFARVPAFWQYYDPPRVSRGFGA